MTWAPDYVTVAELKSFVRVDDTVDDVELALIASAASRAVDRCAGRQFGVVAAPVARSYPVRWDRRRCRWIADVDDLQTAVGITGVTGYTLEPRNAVSEGLAWTRMVFSADPRDDDGMITPVAPWGWTTVPNAVKLASRLQGSRFVARRDSPYGIAGSPQNGSELRLLARVDPDVAVSLAFYVRDWWAA
jgi:hypothetical protein